MKTFLYHTTKHLSVISVLLAMFSYTTNHGQIPSTPTEFGDTSKHVNSSIFIPDPNKTYYIDCPAHNIRIASTGESDTPYTTTMTTTGDDVEWKFVDKGNGYWHIDRAAGGTKPRLRSNNSGYADMQRTSSSGRWTYYDITKGFSKETHFITLPNGPSDSSRLQVNNSNDIKMVPPTSARAWESFTITEASSTISIHIEAEDYSAMNGIQTQKTSDIKGGLNIGSIDPGDWLEYIIDIPKTSNYTINFRVASTPGSAAFQLIIDGNLLSTIDISSTGDWQEWTTLSQNTELSSGSHTIQLYSTDQKWNINWLEIVDGTTAEITDANITKEITRIEAYPIPTKNILNLLIPDHQEYSRLEIIDMAGKTILTNSNISNETVSLNVENLSKGLYIAKIYRHMGASEVIQFFK